MLPYHQSISTSPFNPIPPFTQISTRTNFIRMERNFRKKIENFKNYPILLLRISKSLIPLFSPPESRLSRRFSFNFHRPILSREKYFRMKIIFTRFEKTKRNILQANYTRNSLLIKMPEISTWKRGKRSQILPISRPLIRPLLRAFISSFLFRGFSLNVETASHYRSFVVRDVNKRDVETRGGRWNPPKKVLFL